jgi:hypothetical protein
VIERNFRFFGVCVINQILIWLKISLVWSSCFCFWGKKRYLVQFNNGLEKECFSNSVWKIDEAIPPDVIPHQPATTREEGELEQHAEDAVYQDEDKELTLEADEGNEEEKNLRIMMPQLSEDSHKRWLLLGCLLRWV